MKPFITSIAIAGLFSMAACNSSANKEKDAALLIQQHTIDSMNTEMAKRKVIDSMNEVSRMNIMIPQVITPVVQPQQSVVTSTRRATRNTYAGKTRRRTTTQSQNTAYQEAPVERRKKGWSAKAKGAVIGTGVGAITGAVVNKRNRGAGAVIGGILGAGAGTGVGAIIDHKKGR